MCRCIFDIFVGRKVISTSYSSAILKVPPHHFLNMLGLNSVLPLAQTSVHLRQGPVPLEAPTLRPRAKCFTGRAGPGGLKYMTIHHAIPGLSSGSRQPALPPGNFRLELTV